MASRVRNDIPAERPCAQFSLDVLDGRQIAHYDAFRPPAFPNLLVDFESFFDAAEMGQDNRSQSPMPSNRINAFLSMSL